MRIRHGATFTLCLLSMGAVSACGSESASPTEPQGPSAPSVESIDVVSPIDTLLDIGWATQLSAAGYDSSGQEVSGLTFSWTTSSSAVATVSSSGLIDPKAPGVVRITAASSGASGVRTFQIVDADIEGIEAVISDPYTAALNGALSDPVRTSVSSTLSRVMTSAADGNLVDLSNALSDADESLASSAVDERPIAEVLTLMVQHGTSLLNR